MAYEDILDMIHEPDLSYPPPEWFPDRPSGLPWEGYYYSAYGIAVKHGFPGTEEEWLLSLKGERGANVELRFNSDTNYLQQKPEDETEWQDLMSLTELQTELEAATIAEVEAARDASEGHATSAASSAATASGYAADAASSASSAGTSATSASSSATSASTSADAAALSATAASGYADDAEDAMTAAQTASANAQTSAGNASTSAAAAAQSVTDAAASAAEAAAILEEFTTPTASATTLDSGQPATASYASGHFTFGLPRGDRGVQGNPGVSPTIVTTSIAGGHRVTVTDAQGTRYFDVMDGEGSGDMTSAVYDADSAVATSGGIAEYVAANGGKIDTIKKNGTALPITNKAVDITVPVSASDVGADPAGTASAAVAPINAKIPAQASSINQLADKDFVNSSIENVAAYYITKDAAGNPFATKAELNAATVFYSGGAVRTPTRNDYCVVLADESKTITETGENPTTRYLYYNGWNYQYVVNRSGLTAAQWSAVNSGITAAAVTQIETNRQAITGKISASEKGAANGVTPLNTSSKIDDAYLPSYVGKTSGSSAFTIGRDSNGIYVDY